LRQRLKSWAKCSLITYGECPSRARLVSGTAVWLKLCQAMKEIAVGVYVVGQLATLDSHFTKSRRKPPPDIGLAGTRQAYDKDNGATASECDVRQNSRDTLLAQT
jgi:hypothetical protein